jgi:signal transduction histidine kinase
MRSNRFVIWLGLLVVATLSVGILAFLLLQREGGRIRDNAEQSRLMADEATSRAKLYHEMAKQSREMAKYAEKAAEDSLAIRARTVADNIDLIMSELRDGLMLGLQSLGNQLEEEEMLSWSNSNRWVASGFVWEEGEELADSIDIKNRNLSVYKKKDGFPSQKAEKAKEAFDDSFAQVERDELRKENQYAGALPSPSKPARTISNESMIADQVSSNDQSGALDALERQRTNSKALYSQINAPLAKQQAPISKKPDSQVENYREAQSFLSQNIAKLNLQQSIGESKKSSWATGLDNFRSSKVQRKQLREAVRNDIQELEVMEEVEEVQQAFSNDEVQFQSREGLSYDRKEDSPVWLAWRQSDPVKTLGLELQAEEVIKSLKSGFPENLVEGESFVLKDGQGIEVCSVGEMPLQDERFVKVSVPVGEELPGWNLDAKRVLPPEVVLPPTELPDEQISKLGSISSVLGISFNPERGGYLAFSAIISLTLVAAFLLGGSVLLIQVRRNSLEAVKKTTFVSTVSHELKTPLTTIRMYGEMLGDGMVKDEEKREGYLQTIISESQRLTRLVNNVLDFGRLERGEKTYNWEQVEVGSVVAGIIETQSPRLERNEIKVEWSDESRNGMAKLDSDALEQILLNLLDNLVKYGSDGKFAGVRLFKDKKNITLEVADHGPGIPTEQREKIFETFHRADDALTSTKPGCGIGLSIAQKLVEDMQGTIACEPNHPEGTCFRIVFPLIKEA